MIPHPVDVLIILFATTAMAAVITLSPKVLAVGIIVSGGLYVAHYHLSVFGGVGDE